MPLRPPRDKAQRTQTAVQMVDHLHCGQSRRTNLFVIDDRRALPRSRSDVQTNRYFRFWNFIFLTILRYLCRAIFLRLFLTTLPIRSPPVWHSPRLVSIIAHSITNWQSSPAFAFCSGSGAWLRSRHKS